MSHPDSDQRLAALLEEAANSSPIRPAPIKQMVTRVARRRRRSRGLAIAVAFLIAATGGVTWLTRDHEPTVLSGGHRIVLVGHSKDRGGAGVGIAGTARFIGRCLSIGDTVTIWPPGTIIRSKNPFTIEVPGLGQVAVGDNVTGGGYISTAAKPADDTHIPASCQTQEVLSFFPNS